MIIKSARIKVGGGGAAARHVLDRTDNNESVMVLAGSRETILNAEGIARVWGKTYGLRHITISPDQPLDAAQLRQTVGFIMAEYGLSADRPMTLIEHVKPRADGSKVPHYHLLVAEVDLNTGKVLDSRHTRRRDEKLSRLCEAKFGHTLTRGAHNRAAIAALRREGRADVADAIAALGEGTRPKSAFDENQHQQAKRQGIDLAATRHRVRDALQRSSGPEQLVRALGDHGLRLLPGRKAGVWVVVDRSSGTVLGGLHRLAQQKQADVRNFMKGRSDGTDRESDLRRGSGRAPRGGEAAAVVGVAGRAGRRIADHVDPRRAGRPDGSGAGAGYAGGSFQRQTGLPDRLRFETARLNMGLDGHKATLGNIRSQARLTGQAATARRGASPSGGGNASFMGSPDGVGSGNSHMLEGGSLDALTRFFEQWGAEFDKRYQGPKS